MMESIINFDVAVTEFFNAFSSPVLDKIMIFFTTLGEGGALWIILGIVLVIFKKTRLWGISLLISLAFSFLLSQLILKNLVDRPRPFYALENIKLLIDAPLGTSFPSSHAATAFASATSLFSFNKKYGALALALAIIIAFSRVYLCVHFVSDVVAGAFLGIMLGTVISMICKIKPKEDEAE